ncbi:MAG: Holliday junction branch migration protein RuvA [Syntrophomonadaceae bacterium]|jgi:Holliday junction DNA helicase RuvA
MIAFVKGILHDSRPDLVVIDVNGLGYEINVHPRVISRLPMPGQDFMLYTHLAVSENECKLYGFLDQAELGLFRLLLTVSGIGARAAMNTLATMEPAQFYQAILSRDEKALMRIPGIGKKSAQRLLFELKDKVGQEEAITPVTADGGQPLAELMEALEALGYSRSEVYADVMELQKSGQLSQELADNVKLVLKRKAQQLKK